MGSVSGFVFSSFLKKLTQQGKDQQASRVESTMVQAGCSTDPIQSFSRCQRFISLGVVLWSTFKIDLPNLIGRIFQCAMLPLQLCVSYGQTFLFTPLSIPNFRFFARVCKHHATEDLSFVLIFVTITLKGDDKGHLTKYFLRTHKAFICYLSIDK